MLNLPKLIESRVNAIQAQQAGLITEWSPYLGAVDKYLVEKGKPKLDHYQRHNVAQCLENATFEGGMRHKNRIFETTYSDNITFLGVQLPVIAALLPLTKMAA